MMLRQADIQGIIRRDVLALPDGWRLAEEYEPNAFWPNTAAAMFTWLGEPVPEVWTGTMAHLLLDRIDDRNRREIDALEKMYEAHALITLPRRQANARASAAKRALKLTALQTNVLALETQLGIDATPTQISDALAKRGMNHSPNAVRKAQHVLRGKGIEFGARPHSSR